MASGASPVSTCKRLSINSAIRMPASTSSLSACHRASLTALSVLPSPFCHLGPALRSVLRRTSRIHSPILLQLEYGHGDSFTIVSLGITAVHARCMYVTDFQRVDEVWHSNHVPSSQSNVSYQDPTDVVYCFLDSCKNGRGQSLGTNRSRVRFAWFGKGNGRQHNATRRGRRHIAA